MSSDAAPIEEPTSSRTDSQNVAIQVSHLSKIYRLYERPQDRLKEAFLGLAGRRCSTDFVALNDVSFEVARGTKLGVVGRNGSGKSTLLQILAGTLQASQGDAFVNGRVAALLELGSGFNPAFTGRENVFLNAAILGLSRQEVEARFDAIAAFADIGSFMDQPVNTYSSGMFMRLAFAVTTSVDADVLLVDEALAVGDVFFAQKCFTRMEEVMNRGGTVLLVTHDTSALNQFCDRVLVLDSGRLVYDGDTVGGLRTYFALQRSPGTSARHVAPRAPVAPLGASVPWPPPSQFLPLDSASVIGTGQARCTGIALCDSAGRATDVFEIGDVAVFYTEFEVDSDLEVPVCGVSLVNERNVVVHGRNSLQYGVDMRTVAAGARLRVRQSIRLDIAPGRYTFVVGLASIPLDAYEHASTLSHAALHERTSRVLSIDRIGAFSVTLRRDGLELPFHGLCQLEGDCRIEHSVLSVDAES